MGDMPVFVKLDEYREITDVMNLAREELQKAKAEASKVLELDPNTKDEVNTFLKSL